MRCATTESVLIRDQPARVCVCVCSPRFFVDIFIWGSGDSAALRLFFPWGSAVTAIGAAPADMSGLMQVIPLGRGCVNGCRGVMEVQTGGSGSRHTLTSYTGFLSSRLLMLHVLWFLNHSSSEKSFLSLSFILSTIGERAGIDMLHKSHYFILDPPSLCSESVKYSLFLFKVCHNDGFYLLCQNFLPAENTASEGYFSLL